MEFAAGLVIFRRNINHLIEFLLLQASYEPYHWSPPKGHKEQRDATDIEAAVRETEEESGLKASDYKIIENSMQILNYKVPPHNKDKTVKYWLAELHNSAAKVVLSSEHTDFKWVTISDALDLVKFDDIRIMLTKMNKMIN